MGANMGRLGSSLQIASIFKGNNTGYVLREWKEGRIGDQGEKKNYSQCRDWENGWTTEIKITPQQPAPT